MLHLIKNDYKNITNRLLIDKRLKHISKTQVTSKVVDKSLCLFNTYSLQVNKCLYQIIDQFDSKIKLEKWIRILKLFVDPVHVLVVLHSFELGDLWWVWKLLDLKQLLLIKLKNCIRLWFLKSLLDYKVLVFLAQFS